MMGGDEVEEDNVEMCLPIDWRFRLHSLNADLGFASD